MTKVVDEKVLSSKEEKESENVLNGLHEACIEGNTQLVTDLIGKYPELQTAVCPRGMTALHYAVQGGHVSLVEMLALNMATDENVSDKSPLHLAAEGGSVEMTLILVGKGARVNAPDKNGKTPLDLAILGKHLDVIKTLLKFNAFSRDPRLLHSVVTLRSGEIIRLIARDIHDVNSKDQKGRTALHIAAHLGCAEVVDVLLKAGADLRIKCDDEWTPLHYGAVSGKVDVIQQLLARKAVVDEVDSLGLTALHLASQKGDSNIVSILLNNNANINVPTLGGLTPLHYAAMNNHLDIVSRLLEAGAADSPRSLEGFTPLSLALMAGNRDVTNSLVKHGASLNSKTVLRPLHVAAANGFKDVVAKLLLEDSKELNEKDPAGKTPLFLAAEMGHLDVVKVLLKHRASHSVGSTDDCKTPLHAAAENGHGKIINCLQLAGADCGVKDNKGMTPLHLAVLRGHVHVIQELTTNKSQFDIEDLKGNSPLHLVPESGKLDLLVLLVRSGADISKKNYSGDTVLHIAASTGREDMVKYLVEKCEMSVDYLNAHKRTPLHLASAEGREEVVNYLCKKANINLGDDCGLTSLHLATEGCHVNCMEILIQNKAKIDVTAAASARRRFVTKDNKTVDQYYYGETILHLAAKIKEDEAADKVVKYLLAAGVDCNALDSYKHTALHLAVQMGHLRTTETLLHHGADASALDVNGKVPLDLSPAEAKTQIEAYISKFSHAK